MLLRLRGYDTDSAFGGAQAIERIKHTAPDVVFLDLMLPDMDGYQVCQFLKSEATIQQVPVVIVTARIAAENRIESFGVGADDYVPKPYTPDDIFEALDAARAQTLTAATGDIEGRVWLDLQDDGQTLRGLARLRRSIMTRCPNGDRVAEVIKLAWLSADRWARRHHHERVATLNYQLAGDQLTLLVRGEPGWLGTSLDRPAELPASAKPLPGANWVTMAESVFNEVRVDQSEHSVRLVLQLSKLDPDPEQPS
jgi:DNA-binding response OmpR family regulator